MYNNNLCEIIADFNWIGGAYLVYPDQLSLPLFEFLLQKNLTQYLLKN